MARGKFKDKRGGGKTFSAQSAEEIEQRNARLAEFEEEREKRRAEAAEEENGAEAGDDDTANASNSKPKAAEPETPVQVTSAADHRKNLAKLEEVRKRREEAEKRRKAEQDAEDALEADRKQKAAALQEEEEDDDDKKKKKKSKAKDIPKLSKIEIKKMKPALLKEALKERGLDIQGNAKTLTERLLAYEASR